MRIFAAPTPTAAERHDPPGHVAAWSRRLLAQTLVATAVVAVSASCIQPAHAAPKATKAAVTATEAAEELALQARARFQAKDFVEAAKLFMQAYGKDPKPALVFNAARAYEEAGMYGDAAGLFRLFVSISQDAEGTAKAKERLAAMEAKSAPAAAAAKADPKASAPIGVRESAMPQSSAAEPAWPRWAVTGSAAAFVVGGVALMAVARADSYAAAALPTRNDGEIATYNSRFDSAEQLWGAGVGVTVVGAGLGAWATWMHLRAPARQAAWQVDVGPQAAQLTMRF